MKFFLLKKSIKFFVDEKNGKIRNIYNNKVIISKDDADSITEFDMVFGEDELKAFKPSYDYLLTIYDCDKAYKELETEFLQIYTSMELNYWLKKHRSLYEYAEKNYMYFKTRKFKNLFFQLDYICHDLQNIVEVNEALNSLDETNHFAIKLWLEKYNRLEFCKVMTFDQTFSKIDFENNLIQFDFNSNIYFTGDDFFAIIKFTQTYHKYNELFRSTNN